MELESHELRFFKPSESKSERKIEEPLDQLQPSQNTLQFNEKMDGYLAVVNQLKIELEDIKNEREMWRKEKKQMQKMIDQISAEKTPDNNLVSNPEAVNQLKTELDSIKKEREIWKREKKEMQQLIDKMSTQQIPQKDLDLQ